MSKLRFTAAALSIAALSGLSTANAQVPTGQPVGQPLCPPIGQPVQTGQPTTLPGQPTNQQAESQNAQGERYEARRVTSDSQTQQGPTVKEALTQKLIKANKAEIELAKIAQQKTDNEELKQLASMIIKDHEQLNQKLQQICDAPTSGQTQPGQAATVPKQLCQVAEQACDNALKMTKDMLSNYEGQDFNMAFLGQQCVAHTIMLAELKAIESIGPQELQQIASQAATKVETHLEKAKQLAKKLQYDTKPKS